MTASFSLFSSAAELARRIQARELSATAVVEAYLARIAAINPRLTESEVSGGFRPPPELSA